MSQHSSLRRKSSLAKWLPILLTVALLLVVAFVRSRPVPPAADSTAVAPAQPPAAVTPSNAGGFQAGEIAVTLSPTPDGLAAGVESTDATAASQPTRKPSATPRPTRQVRATATPDDGLPTIGFSALPRQAQDTVRLIDRGGPFPYRQDGAVFQNRERLLPAKASGYYREYTVITPGESDRGAQRIIAGAGGELYYTADHYDSFKRVVR